MTIRQFTQLDIFRCTSIKINQFSQFILLISVTDKHRFSMPVVEEKEGRMFTSRNITQDILYRTFLLNLVKPELAPFDPPTPKTPL